MKILHLDLHNFEQRVRRQSPLRNEVCLFLDEMASELQNAFPNQEKVKLPDNVVFWHDRGEFNFYRNNVLIYGSHHKTPDHILAIIGILSENWLREFEKSLDEENDRMMEFVERIKKFSEPDNYERDTRTLQET